MPPEGVLKNKTMLLVLYMPFLFFLVIHEASSYFFVDSNRANKAATGPEMIAPK